MGLNGARKSVRIVEVIRRGICVVEVLGRRKLKMKLWLQRKRVMMVGVDRRLMVIARVMVRTRQRQPRLFKRTLLKSRLVAVATRGVDLKNTTTRLRQVVPDAAAVVELLLHQHRRELPKKRLNLLLRVLVVVSVILRADLMTVLRRLVAVGVAIVVIQRRKLRLLLKVGVAVMMVDVIVVVITVGAIVDAIMGAMVDAIVGAMTVVMVDAERLHQLQTLDARTLVVTPDAILDAIPVAMMILAGLMNHIEPKSLTLKEQHQQQQNQPQQKHQQQFQKW